jgi:hypothetical protein
MFELILVVGGVSDDEDTGGKKKRKKAARAESEGDINGSEEVGEGEDEDEEEEDEEETMMDMLGFGGFGSTKVLTCCCCSKKEVLSVLFHSFKTNVRASGLKLTLIMSFYLFVLESFCILCFYLLYISTSMFIGQTCV